MSDNITKRLMLLKDKLSKATADKLRAEGNMETLMKQLKEQHNCDSVEEAEAKLDELDKEEKGLSEKIEAGLYRLETEYDWEE